MTDQVKEEKAVAVEETKVEGEAAAPAPDPTHFKVVVTNTINDVEGEIFARECEYGKKNTMMKSVRQKIRDLGTTIREATVTFNEDKSLQTIAFTDLVVTEKPKVARTPTTSSARKNADSTIVTETDIEILGIANDEDTDREQKTLELAANYTRHQLIHAFNTNREEGEEKLTHYSTQAASIKALLA